MSEKRKRENDDDDEQRYNISGEDNESKNKAVDEESETQRLIQKLAEQDAAEEAARHKRDEDDLLFAQSLAEELQSDTSLSEQRLTNHEKVSGTSSDTSSANTDSIYKSLEYPNLHLKIGSAAVCVESPCFWQVVPENNLINTCSTNLCDVDRDTSEWSMVESELARQAAIWRQSNATAKMPLRLCQLQRVQNVDLWKWYALYREDVKVKRNGAVNEHMLFHAARQASATKQIIDEGFDVRLAQQQGSIGAGIYFATSPHTSRAYAASLSNGTLQMFLANVVLGSSAEKPDQCLRRPPKGFDSVGSEASGQFAVYDNRAAYPTYLLTLSTK